MDQIGQALDLISRYGLALVGTVVLAIVVIWLFKRVEAQWAARLKEKDDHLAYVDGLRLEERKGRLDAEAQLESNRVRLGEISAVFKADQEFQQQLVEQLLDRQPAPRRAGGRASGT